MCQRRVELCWPIAEGLNLHIVRLNRVYAVAKSNLAKSRLIMTDRIERSVFEILGLNRGRAEFKEQDQHVTTSGHGPAQLHSGT